jgi:hypothetical protein
VFRTVVEPFMAPMLHARHARVFGRRIPAQRIGDEYPRHVLTAFQQLPEALLGSGWIAPALHQNI